MLKAIKTEKKLAVQFAFRRFLWTCIKQPQKHHTNFKNQSSIVSDKTSMQAHVQNIFENIVRIKENKSNEDFLYK